MHSQAVIAEVLRLRDDEGLGARRIAKRTGVPMPTVKDWLADRLPRHARHLLDGGDPEPQCPDCGQAEHRYADLPRAYVYLLGLYLGDGTVSSHPRGVYRLRIVLDKKYPRIVDECAEAMAAVMPNNRVGRQLKPSNCWEVWSYSRAWPCLLPQHGRGAKHTRRIILEPWQQRLAEQWPEALLRGMLQSDGCRFLNTGRGGWSHPRYGFKNMSTDLTSIFCTACEELDLHWTGAFPKNEATGVTIYVSRKADVARLDEFVGPKA